MPRSRNLLRLAAFAAGAAATAALVVEGQKRLRRHRGESRAARAELVAGHAAAHYWRNIAGCTTHFYEARPAQTARRPLLLIHGGVVEAASWLDAMADLARDRLVIAPDLPAHGLSGYLPPAQLMNWLEAMVAELGLDEYDLCGHSMGGGLALRFAARSPDGLRRLVLCAPVGTGQAFPRVWPEPWNTGLLDVWPLHDSLIEKVWGEPSLITGDDRRRFGLMFRDFFFTPRWWWYLSGGLFWLLDLPVRRVQTIQAPALFVWGAADRIVPYCGPRTLAYVQALPEARIQFLEGLGHLPQVEWPDTFNRALRTFLDQ